MASPAPNPDGAAGLPVFPGQQMTQDFAQQARRSSDVSNTAGPVRTRRSNRDSFFGGQFGGPAMLQMGFGGSRQSTMIPTPTTPAQLQGPSGSGSSKQRRKDNDSVSVTSTSKEYFGGVMSKLSNAFSKAKHAVTGKESSDSLAAPGKRSKWGLPGSSRRSSVSSNAPYGYAEDGMHSPQLAMVPSETNSMYSRDEPAEDSVEGLISLSLYDEERNLFPCFRPNPSKGAYLYRFISPRAQLGRRAMEEAWELVYVEIRGPFVVFYRDVDGDGPNGMSGTRLPLNYMVITSSTAVDKNGSNPAIVRIWLPRHTIALRSSSRDDSVMNDWFRSLCDKVDEAKRATVSTVGSPTEVERHDASEDSVVSHPATPISASRQTTNAMPGSPYSAVSPSYVAGPPQAAGPVEWSAVTGSASASQSATSVSSNSSSKKSKEKGKSKDSSAAEGDPSYMRWFGMGRWKDNGNLTPLSVPDTSKHLPTVPETPRSKEETDQEKWRGVARRNKKERDETKGRTVDSRSFKNKLYGVAGMVSKDDSYIITRKPWSGSGESVASGEEGVGSAASAGPMSAPLVSPAETPVSPAGLYPLPATGSGSPTTISPVSQSRPVPAQQTPSYHRISNTMASAARGSSPTRHSVGGTTDLDGDPSPMTWAHRSVRREPSIMTATTGTSMPRRRKVIDSPVDNRHSIGDGRGSIAGDKRQSVLSDNRHSLATSNYSANHTIPEPAVGVDLDNLPPIPVWLRKCVALVDEMGLDQEGIYRVSGNSSTIVALKKLFAERGDEIELLLPANAQSPKSSEDLRSAVPPTTTISIPIRQRPPSYHRRSMSFSGTPHSIAPLQPTMPADPRLLYDNDIHVITGVIKSFLRDGFGPTKEPLVESRLYDRFLEVARMEDYRTRMIALQDLVHQMSADHFAMLKYIAEHLNRVSQNSHVNRMTSRNLAIVFAPTLLMKAPDSGIDHHHATAFAMGRLLVDTPVLSTVVETMIDYASWVFGPIEYEEEELGMADDDGHEFGDIEGASVTGSLGAAKELHQRMSRVSITSENRFRAQRSSIGGDSFHTRPLSFEKHPELSALAMKRESVQWEGEDDAQRARDALRRDRKNDSESLYRRKLRNRTQHLALDQWESLPEISSAAHIALAAAPTGTQERSANAGLRWSWTPANNARDYGLSSSAEASEAPFKASRFSGAPEPKHRERKERDENEVVANWRRSLQSTHTTASTPSRQSIGSVSRRSNRPQSEVFIARPPSLAESLSHRSSLVLSEA